MWRRVLLVVAALLVAASCSDPDTLAGLPRVSDADCDEEVIGDDGASLVAAFTVAMASPPGSASAHPTSSSMLPGPS